MPLYNARISEGCIFAWSFVKDWIMFYNDPFLDLTSDMLLENMNLSVFTTIRKTRAAMVWLQFTWNCQLWFQIAWTGKPDSSECHSGFFISFRKSSRFQTRPCAPAARQGKIPIENWLLPFDRGRRTWHFNAKLLWGCPSGESESKKLVRQGNILLIMSTFGFNK